MGECTPLLKSIHPLQLGFNSAPLTSHYLAYVPLLSGAVKILEEGVFKLCPLLAMSGKFLDTRSKFLNPSLKEPVVRQVH